MQITPLPLLMARIHKYRKCPPRVLAHINVRLLVNMLRSHGLLNKRSSPDSAQKRDGNTCSRQTETHAPALEDLFLGPALIRPPPGDPRAPTRDLTPHGDVGVT